MDVSNSLSNDKSNKVFDKSKTDHNRNKNGNGSSDYQSILLKLSEDLQKENVLSEIKYTPLNKSLKIAFSKQYNDKVIFAFLDVNKWQNSLEKIEKKI